MNAPVCGKPMRNYEARLRVPVLEDPVCGRRPGHPGPCRSVAALEKIRLAKAESRGRLQVVQNRWRQRRRLHENLTAVIAAAVAQAERDARIRAEWPVSRRAAA